jgi:uncharacterized iron-regulated protein
MKTSKLLFCLFGLLFAQNSIAQEPVAYTIFSSEGKVVPYKKMVQELRKKQVVLFGELHDNAIAHWMELLVAQSLYETTGNQLAIGAEMFETHQAPYLAAYLATGDMKTLRDSTKLWSNFGTDYKPLLEFAFNHQVNYFASNVPRKYASMVFKKGTAALDSLSVTEKALMCPLPFAFDSTLTQYKSLIKMGLEMHASGINFAKAQAIKDATMAWFIVQALKTKKQVFHLNGSYHSDFYQSIFWYLKLYQPTITIATISTITQEDLTKLAPENKGKADFIIVVDDTITRTME